MRCCASAYFLQYVCEVKHSWRLQRDHAKACAFQHLLDGFWGVVIQVPWRFDHFVLLATRVVLDAIVIGERERYAASGTHQLRQFGEHGCGLHQVLEHLPHYGQIHLLGQADFFDKSMYHFGFQFAARSLYECLIDLNAGDVPTAVDGLLQKEPDRTADLNQFRTGQHEGGEHVGAVGEDFSASIQRLGQNFLVKVSHAGKPVVVVPQQCVARHWVHENSTAAFATDKIEPLFVKAVLRVVVPACGAAAIDAVLRLREVFGELGQVGRTQLCVVVHLVQWSKFVLHVGLSVGARQIPWLRQRIIRRRAALPPHIIGTMLLRAGLVSVALLILSRLLGMLRESGVAAAFGATAQADAAIVMLSLPDWSVGVFLSGMLAYVLLPHWASKPQTVAATQRRVTIGVLGAACAVAALLAGLAPQAAHLLLPGLRSSAEASLALKAIQWAAVGVPLAALAAVWSTRLQHEQDFLGLYGANLVVNGGILTALFLIAVCAGFTGQYWVLPVFFLMALMLRLVWLRWRLPCEALNTQLVVFEWPPVSQWLWAALASGLPLALPMAARALVSEQGAGSVAVFSYAWKLIELPLFLAIQLVTTLALPVLSRAFASGDAGAARQVSRQTMALAWGLACACMSALWLGYAGVAKLLFGWGAAQNEWRAVANAALGAISSLAPQAVIAVSTAVLAAQKRMVWAALGQMLLLALFFSWVSPGDSLDVVMTDITSCVWVAGVFIGVAAGFWRWSWLPWGAVLGSAVGLAFSIFVIGSALTVGRSVGVQLALATLSGCVTLLACFGMSADFRAALKR